MRTQIKCLHVLSLLVLSGVFSACDRATELTAPPEAESAVRVQSRKDVRVVAQPVEWTTQQSGTVRETLNSGGGTLKLVDGEGGPTIVGLDVPAGAITGGHIEYTITLDCSNGPYCVVDLQATRNGHEVARFRKGVELSINLDYLTFENESTLGLAQVVNGTLVPVKTSTVEGGFLKATLTHFSLYAPFSGYLPISD